MISDEYRKVLQQADGELWQGTKAWHKCRWEILKLIGDVGAKSTLDFGSADGGLSRWLGDQLPDLVTYDYDPRKDDVLEDYPQVDVVISTDVLEHVEEDMVPATLVALAHLARKGQYHCICTRKAGAVLSDGRNAHLTVWPRERWIKELRKWSTGWMVKPRPAGRPHILDVEMVPEQPPEDRDSPEYRRWHETARAELKWISGREK